MERQFMATKEEIQNLKIYDNKIRDFFGSDRRYFKYDITPKSIITRKHDENVLTVTMIFYNENVCNTGIISRIENENIDKEVYLVNLGNVVAIERLTRSRGEFVKRRALNLLKDYIQNELPDTKVVYAGEVS